MKLKDFLKTNQQAIILVLGYALVATLAFGLGRYSFPKSSVSALPVNYSPNIPAVQSATTTIPAATGADQCAGQIKGSSSMIYHVPGGAFYEKTTHPIRCFGTETEAQAAGFRKSSR